MENLQILITDSSAEFLDALTERLRGDFSVATCQNGRQAWKMIQAEQPGILVLDLLLPGLDGLSLLQQLPTENRPKVLAMTNFLSNYVVEACQKLGVSYLMRKPCDLDATARRVRDMAEELRPPTVTLADPRTTVSNMLLRLGIPTKMRGYAFLREAVLVMAHDRTQSVTKELYPTVAQRCGGNPLQVERTIRAAIHSAWDNRDESVWQQVFHTDGPIPRPTNSAIISLLAEQLGNDDNEAS